MPKKLVKKKLPAVFYVLASGREPVRDWLKALDDDTRKVIGIDIMQVELRWPVGLPLCRPLGDGLWEVRSTIPKGIARVIFCIHDGEMVLLHGFIKKTQKTPQDHLDLAIKRQKEVENG